jgi:hypothetical protein
VPSPIPLPAHHTTPAEINDGDSALDSDSAWSAHLKFNSMKTRIEMEDSDEEEPLDDLEDLEEWDKWEVGKLDFIST